MNSIPVGISIGERLRDLRQSAGFTMSAAAAQIGCDQSYLSKLERGISRRPSADFTRRAATVFQVNEDWLRTGLGKPSAQKPSHGEDELEQDAQFLAAITMLLQQMTITQLLRAARDIDQSNVISPARKAIWIRLLADWVSVKSKLEKEVDRTILLEVDRALDLKNKRINLQEWPKSFWDQLRSRVVKFTAKRGARAALARQIQVSPKALNEWLKGRSAPPAEQTLRLVVWVDQQTVAQAKAEKKAEGAPHFGSTEWE